MPTLLPDISVIVLTYYHEKYIAQALESILSQETHLTYEILVGDDASGDHTPEILQEYAARYPGIIKLVLRKKNTGANYNSMDMGRRAIGKYIAYLEGDDFWLDPHKLQKQYDFLDTHPEYSACFGKCAVSDEDGQIDYDRVCHFVLNKRVYTLDDLLDTWQIPGQASTQMYRNGHPGIEELEEKGDGILYKAHPNVGDKTGTLLLLMSGPIYCFNDVFSAYRVVDKKDGHNWFSIHHANPYRDYDMFMYPCRLESWARKNLKLPRGKHFGARNPYRFARFVEDCVREPSLERLKRLGEMVMHSHQPLRYSWLILKSLIEME